MKGAMYLTENLPIQYKLSSFTQKNLECIEDHWEDTKFALECSVRLIARFGFIDRNLVARLGLLPIAQYMRNRHLGNLYISSSSMDDVADQTHIQKWLIMMILKGTLGSATDRKLNIMRNVIDMSGSQFPYDDINKALAIDPSFNDMEIENMLDYGYSTRYSYLVLSLLYPGRDWKDKVYNEDHIFPQTEFQTKKLRARGYDDAQIEAYQKVFNSILNLELLDESENKSKNARPFDEWIKTRDDNFKKRHHIPEMEHYDFDHFLEFIDARKKMLAQCIRDMVF